MTTTKITRVGDVELSEMTMTVPVCLSMTLDLKKGQAYGAAEYVPIFKRVEWPLALRLPQREEMVVLLPPPGKLLARVEQVYFDPDGFTITDQGVVCADTIAQIDLYLNSALPDETLGNLDIYGWCGLDLARDPTPDHG